MSFNEIFEQFGYYDRGGGIHRSISKDPWFSNDVNREHGSRDERGKALCVGSSLRRRQRRSEGLLPAAGTQV